MTTRLETDNGQQLTDDEAAQHLANSRRKRQEACQRDLAAILELHRCRLTATVLITEQGIAPQIAIVPTD